MKKIQVMFDECGFLCSDLDKIESIFFSGTTLLINLQNGTSGQLQFNTTARALQAYKYIAANVYPAPDLPVNPHDKAISKALDQILANYNK